MLRLVFVAVLAVIALTGCFDIGGAALAGSGTPGDRVVSVADVEAVRLSVPGTLVVTPGAGPLRIEGDDNVTEALEVTVEDGVLEIAAPSGRSVRPDLPLRMNVGVDRLAGVTIAGSGRIEAAGVDTDALDVSIGGSGSVGLTDLRARAVAVSVAGSGDLAASGRADLVTVSVAGSGGVDLSALTARDVEISVSGSGAVAVHADERLDVSVRGSGTVRYAGSPDVTSRVSGSGELSQIGK